MEMRRRKTKHKVGSGSDEYTVYLTEPADAHGAEFSNWQLVNSDTNGIYIICAQLNLMGANDEEKTVDGRVLSHIFIPHSQVDGFLSAIQDQVMKHNQKAQEEQRTNEPTN